MISKMMPTLLALALLAIGVAYVYRYESGEIKDREKGESILVQDKDAIMRVEIKNAKTKDLSIVLEREKDKKEWKLVSPVKAQTDSNRVQELVDKLAKFESKRAYDKPDKPLADYGLEKPETVVKWSGEKGGGEFSIGQKLDVEASHYVKSASSEKLYMVDSYALDIFMSDANSFREKKVITVDSEKAVGVRMLAKDGSVREFKRQGDKWQMVSPSKMKASTDAVKNMLSAFGGIWVEEFVHDAPKQADLAQYGLDKPEYTVTIANEKDEGTRSLLVGKKKPGDDGRTHVKRENSDSVYLVSSSSLIDLTKPTEDFREKRLWEDVNSTKMKKVAITGPNTDLKAERDASGNWKFVNPKVRKEAHTALSSLAIALENARAKNFVRDDREKWGEYRIASPEWTIAFEGDGFAARKLEFGAPVPDKGRTVRFGGDGLLAVLEEDLVAKARPVVEAYNAILDFPPDKATALKVRHYTNESIEMAKDDKGSWKVTAPPATGLLDPTTKANAVVDAVAALPAEQWLAHSPEAAKSSGMDHPEWHVEITLKEGAGLVLDVSAQAEGNVRPAMTGSVLVKAAAGDLVKKLNEVIAPLVKPASPVASPSPAASEAPASPVASPSPAARAAPASPEPAASPPAAASPEPAASPSVAASPEPVASPSAAASPSPVASPSPPAAPIDVNGGHPTLELHVPTPSASPSAH